MSFWPKLDSKAWIRRPGRKQGQEQDPASSKPKQNTQQQQLQHLQGMHQSLEGILPDIITKHEEI